MSDQIKTFNLSLGALQKVHGTPSPMSLAKPGEVLNDIIRTAKIVVVDENGNSLPYDYDQLKNMTSEQLEAFLATIAPHDPVMLEELKKYFHQGGFRSSAKMAVGAFDSSVAFQEASREDRTEIFTFKRQTDGSIIFEESYHIGNITFKPDPTKPVGTVLRDPIAVDGDVRCVSKLSLLNGELQQTGGEITLTSSSPELSTQFKKMLPTKPTINPKEWEEAEAYFKTNPDAKSFKSSTTPAHDFVKVGGQHASIYVHPNANEISQDHEFELAGFSGAKLAFSKNVNAKPDVIGINKEGIPEMVTYGTLASTPEFFGPNNKTQLDELQKDLEANYKAENIKFLKLLHDLKATGPDFNPKNKGQARLLADLKKYIPIGAPQEVNLSAALQKTTQEAMEKHIRTFGKKTVKGGITELLNGLDDAKAEVITLTQTNKPTKNNAAVPIQNYLKPVGAAPTVQEKIEMPTEPVKKAVVSQQLKSELPSKIPKSTPAAEIRQGFFQSVRAFFTNKSPAPQQSATPATVQKKLPATKLERQLGASKGEIQEAQTRAQLQKSSPLPSTVPAAQRAKLEKFFGTTESLTSTAPLSSASASSEENKELLSTPPSPPPIVLSGGPAVMMPASSSTTEAVHTPADTSSVATATPSEAKTIPSRRS